MNRHYDSDNDLQELRDSGGQDREISLGTATILGIFFVLALLCAVFFGFGYSMGRRSTHTVINATETMPASDSTDSKPAPGEPGSGAVISPTHKITEGTSDIEGSGVDSTASVEKTANTSPRSTSPRFDSPVQPQANPAIKPVSLPRLEVATTAAPVPVPVPGIGGAIVVQVAAVSHQEDANVLAGALKKRGYSVAIRQVPQDKLLHVQLGPFASKKDADAMRQRLLADGYNAIVK